MKRIELLNYIKSIRKQEEVNEETSKEIIAILEDNLKKLRHELKRSELSRFLYFTCHKFNRFSIPTNYYHLNDEFNYFKRYVELFEKVENGFSDNTLTLKVDLLTWELLNQENEKAPINYNYYLSAINDLYDKISCLSPQKRKEFIEHYERFINLFSGIKNRNIYTHVSCLIPVTPVVERSILQLTYNNYPTKIIINPIPLQNPMVSSGKKDLITLSANSNWQFAYCEVEVIITGYIDLLIAGTKLFLEPNQEDLNSVKVFTFLYKLLSQVFWKIKTDNADTPSNWQIQPIDIEKVTHRIISNDQEMNWIQYPIKTSFIVRRIVDNIVPKKIVLEDKIHWYRKCFLLATDSLSMGNTHQSLFWLNIGIEAFFMHRIPQICEENHIEEKILFSENYFDRTKRELEKLNDEDVLKKIKWPKEGKIHMSIFKKIKILSQKKLLKSDKNKVMSKYQKVSQHRNLVFHGESDDPIPIADVKEALKAYSWLLDNF